MAEVKVLILAAGQGKRMKSKLPKVLLPVCGVPMLQYVIWEAQKLTPDKPLVVVGYQGEKVIAQMGDQADYVWQREQLGTGHAVQIACAQLSDYTGDLLVLYGDTPFISASSLQELLNLHRTQEAAATVLTAELEDPAGYGRILRTPDGRLAGIIEDRDASAEQRLIREVNTGIYCFSSRELREILPCLEPQNAQGEYYLTDVITILAQRGKILQVVKCQNPKEIMGPNDRQALAETERVMRMMILERLMEDGVSIIDPANTYVDPRVKVGQDTTLYPGTVLVGETVIGSDCRIGPYTQITNSRIGEGCHVHFSILTDVCFGKQVECGPYAHCRPGTVAADGAKIGGFVEVKNVQIGEGSKVPHLSYLGDTEVGAGVNIGAGTITCNYDGVRKWRTIIEDGAFIGSNTNLVAPVRVGKRALIGAGSTITRDVPADSLAIARARQIHKVGTPKVELAPAAGEQFMVTLNSPVEGAILYYSLDGEEPCEGGNRYHQPLILRAGTLLKVKAFKEGWNPSKTVVVKIGEQ